MLLFENPEDLGAVQQGNLYGQRPASMWQWPTFFELLEKQGWETVAFYQADFGTEYLKPTRLLLKGFQTQQQTAFVQGRPSFDEQGFYEGPLTKREAIKQLIGHAGNSFVTKGTEQWPSELCRWIALQILEKFHTSVVLASGGVQQNTTTTSEKLQPQNQKAGRYVVEAVNQGSADPQVRPENSMMVQVWLHQGVGTWNVGHGTQMVFGRNLGKDPCVWFWKAAVVGKSLTWSVFKWRPRVNKAAT